MDLFAEDEDQCISDRKAGLDTYLYSRLAMQLASFQTDQMKQKKADIRINLAFFKEREFSNTKNGISRFSTSYSLFNDWMASNGTPVSFTLTSRSCEF